jgi:hypothetical protein
MSRILFICPHLSTGGSCQVTFQKLQALYPHNKIKVVEYNFYGKDFVVQRNRILELVGKDKFVTLDWDKTEILSVISSFEPDIIAMEEFPELFMNEEISARIYSKKIFGGGWKIIETTHESTFDLKNKLWMPDHFVFVSPYSALKYIESGLTIPYEIIEYPVDKIKHNPLAIQTILGLEDDYKHIVIIGLFTPRKNQAYCFELSKLLSDYKIKFHFLGNMAGNFQSYWQPLIDDKNTNPKLNNCIIWGERSDTDLFLQAADLFLFASKGDCSNKELNPLVIKEADCIEGLPKLFFDLDVYCDRYGNDPFSHFLTGNIEEDVKTILEITKPKQIFNTMNELEEIIIIGTYPNLQSRVELTEKCIESLKPLNRKIMLVSHYPVHEKLQEHADYYVYDKENPMIAHSYYTRFFNYTPEYDVDININGLKHSNQSLAVLTNLFNAMKYAQSLGYKKAFYITYDVIVNELDLSSIENSFNWICSGNKAYLATLDTPFGKGIQTTAMTFDIDFFLSSFDNPRNEDDFNKVCKNLGCENFLEDYFMKAINIHHRSRLQIITNPEQTFLVHSGLGISSNSEYYSIVPVSGKENTFMLYFYTYNIDNREINFVINVEAGVGLCNESIFVFESREFKKEFKFYGNTIFIKINFFDGLRKYKSEIFEMTKDNVESYKNNGLFTYKTITPKPKIKLVHLQTTNNDKREKASRESVAPLIESGAVTYVNHTNEPYVDLPPKSNCMRPDCVSMELFSPLVKLTALTPAHYGCYEAFKNAILCEFDQDLDFLMIMEGDCIIEKPMPEFIDIIYKACEAVNQNNIGMFSFGDKSTLDEGWYQSPVIENINDLLYKTNHIIGLQCIIFPRKVREFLFEKIRKTKWDAADMYFNHIFHNSEYSMGILHERATTQADGYSLIDRTEKTFRKK